MQKKFFQKLTGIGALILCHIFGCTSRHDFATAIATFAATAIVRGVRVAGQEGRALRARLSLAATAHLLGPSAVEQPSVASVAAAASDLTDWQELTPWGPARRLRFPITINGNQPVWPHPAGPLRSAQARWLSA